MQTVLEALAHPTRREIIVLLESGERTAGDLAAQFSISWPAVSRHLRVLHAAGLIQSRPRAQQRVFRLDPTPLAELDAWLAHHRPYWCAPLDALDVHLNRRNARPRPEHYGVIERDGDALALRFERHYPLSVEAVCAAPIEPERLAAWLPEGSIAWARRPRRLRLGEQGTGRAPITAWEPPHVLELQWVETEGPPSAVRIELTPADHGTRLVLLHTRIREAAAEDGAGWH